VSRFLYKFRTLFPADESSVDRMRDILMRSKLWLSSPVDFNDPFDMSAKFIAGATIEEKRERIKELLKNQGLKWSEIQRELPRLVSKPDSEISAMAQTTWQNAVKSTGIYSFGGDPRSILMWSHYSSNHEGLCLQFERAEDPRTFLHAIPVEYNDEYPIVNWFTGFQDGLIPAMQRKHVGWSYEHENRILLIGKAHQYLSFSPEALKGIILGCKVDDETVSKLQDLLEGRSSFGYSRPTLYKAIQHETEYRLVIRRMP